MSGQLLWAEQAHTFLPGYSVEEQPHSKVGKAWVTEISGTCGWKRAPQTHVYALQGLLTSKSLNQVLDQIETLQ